MHDGSGEWKFVDDARYQKRGYASANYEPDQQFVSLGEKKKKRVQILYNTTSFFLDRQTFADYHSNFQAARL